VTRWITILVATLLPVASPLGQPSGDHAEAKAPPAVRSDPLAVTSDSESVSLTEGEVRKIDTGTQKLTIRHGPIPNLGMAAMTMNFYVADPAWLTSLSPGDRIRFAAERVDGRLTIVTLEVAD